MYEDKSAAIAGLAITRSWKVRGTVRGGLVRLLIPLSCLVAAIFIVSSTAAQQVPGPAELKPQVPPERVLPLQRRPEQPDIEVPETTAPELPIGAESIRFSLSGITLEGITAYDPAVFEAIFADSLNKEVALADLYRIAELIERRYREDGYFVSRVVVPAQKVSDGVFRLQVVEGFISAVQLEGEIGASRDLAIRTLEKITRERPVHINDVERYLLLVNDLPGIEARGVLRPAAGEIGAAELVVKAERQILDGFTYVDNRGSEFTGPLGAAIGLGVNSLSPVGERTELVGFAALDGDEQQVGQLTHELRIGSEGLTARLNGSYAKSEPGGDLEPLDLEEEAYQIGLSGAYPVVRARRFNLNLSGGFDAVNQDIDALGDKLVRDRLRVLWLGVDSNYHDSLAGVTSGEFGLRQGLPIFGASESGDDDLSRADGDGTFTALSAQLGRIQQIHGGFSLFVNGYGQYAFNELLSYEEFDLGNTTVGRGYDPAELTGEHALAGTLELRFDQAPELPFLQAYQVYVFYDAGQVWNTDSGLQGVEESDSLSSTGGGLRTSIAEWLSVDLEVAKPLTRDRNDGDDRDLQFYFRVIGRF